MAAKEPYGNTPLTTQDLANLGHPLSASDFNQDAQGRLWRVIRGQKTYYAPEWFDDKGTFVGSGQANDPSGQDKGFFHQGQKWNWESGKWENPTNWANVIGLSAAGAVGAGIAAPYIAGALGGAGSSGGSAVSALGDVGTEVGATAPAAATEAGAVLPSTALPAGLGSTLPAGSVGGSAAIDATLAEPGLTAFGTTVPNTLATPPGVSPSGLVPDAFTKTPGFMSWPGAGGLLKSATGGGGVTSIWDLVVPGVNAGLNLYGQNKQAGAIENASNQQLAATKYATDAQERANQAQLQYLKDQAAYGNMTAEVNRQANYDQWAAKQEQLGSVGQMLGLPARRIPAYVPLPTTPTGTTTAGNTGELPTSLQGLPRDANGMIVMGDQLIDPAQFYAGTGQKPVTNTQFSGGYSIPRDANGNVISGGGGGAPSVSANNGDIGTQVSNYFKSRGVSDAETPYWVQKWAEFGSKDPAYFNSRLSQADIFGGGGGTAAPAAAMTRRYVPLTLDTSLLATDPLRGTLRPYAGNVGSYLV